jgi:hypothetical protein
MAALGGTDRFSYFDKKFEWTFKRKKLNVKEFLNIAFLGKKIDQFWYLNIKKLMNLISQSNQSFNAIYIFKNQNPLNVISQNIKIDADIAIEKTHSHADRIHWAIWQFFLFMKWWKCNASVAKHKFW